MRKIVAGLMMSVDGVVEAPRHGLCSAREWVAVGSLMSNGDTMPAGRVT
jgi:hypothetical protein